MVVDQFDFFFFFLLTALLLFTTSVADGRKRTSTSASSPAPIKWLTLLQSGAFSPPTLPPLPCEKWPALVRLFASTTCTLHHSSFISQPRTYHSCFFYDLSPVNIDLLLKTSPKYILLYFFVLLISATKFSSKDAAVKLSLLFLQHLILFGYFSCHWQTVSFTDQQLILIIT